MILDYRSRKKDILTWLCLRFGVDISLYIYHFYDQIMESIRNEHVYIYGLVKSRTSIYDYQVYPLPYYKNNLFVTYLDYKKFMQSYHTKRNTMMMLKIMGHPDFLCKTNVDLKQKNCSNMYMYLTEIDDIPKFYRDIEILINVERLPLTVREKIHIINRITAPYDKMNYQFSFSCYHTIYELMYNHYEEYIKLKDLYVPGYILDSNNIIYGY